MSTRASLFFASDDGVKIHFFHDVEENKYYLEISCRDDFFDAQPARLCIHLPRIVEQALYQWVIDSGLATSKKASPDPGRIQQVPITGAVEPWNKPPRPCHPQQEVGNSAKEIP